MTQVIHRPRRVTDFVTQSVTRGDEGDALVTDFKPSSSPLRNAGHNTFSAER